MWLKDKDYTLEQINNALSIKQWSIYRLAIAMSVQGPTLYNRIGNNPRNGMSMDMVIQIANALGMHWESLLADADLKRLGYGEKEIANIRNACANPWKEV